MPPVVRKLIDGNRLSSIDALRGIAALSVVLYHAVGHSPRIDVYGYSYYFYWILANLFSYGYAGVYLFFVISGFCIHLFWAKQYASNQTPTVEFSSFWKRRMRRLYPPYLVALVIYLIFIAVKVDVDINGLFLWDILSHLLMIHNLDMRTCYSISGVFWTLAVEEQLYLAYFLLLFMRKRWGWTYTLICCGMARVGWYLLIYGIGDSLGVEVPVSEASASHWFIWALGALSVEAALGIVALPAWCRKFWIGILSLLLAVGITHLLPFSKDPIHPILWLLLHPAWGLGFFILINYLVDADVRWQFRARVPKFITYTASIGLFSYSLYLTHQLIMLESYWFGYLGLPAIVIAFFLVTPSSLILAWIFFNLFEKPFLKSSSKVETSPTSNTAISNSSIVAADS
jgi:peptidoglycan/LPS O-acetylase OafA/YrhL